MNLKKSLSKSQLETMKIKYQMTTKFQILKIYRIKTKNKTSFIHITYSYVCKTNFSVIFKVYYLAMR